MTRVERAVLWTDASVFESTAGFGAVLITSQTMHWCGDPLQLECPHSLLAEFAAMVEGLAWAHPLLPERASLVLRNDNKKAMWLLERFCIKQKHQWVIPSMIDRVIPKTRTPKKKRWRTTSEGSLIVDPPTLPLLRRLTEIAPNVTLEIERAWRDDLEIQLCDTLARQSIGLKDREGASVEALVAVLSVRAER